jgi:hypothetical protein
MNWLSKLIQSAEKNLGPPITAVGVLIAFCAFGYVLCVFVFLWLRLLLPLIVFSLPLVALIAALGVRENLSKRFHPIRNTFGLLQAIGLFVFLFYLSWVIFNR